MEGRERHEEEEEEEEEVEEEARGVFNSPTTIFSVPFIRHTGQLGTTVN